MTESVDLQKDLPDLGGPFLYWDQNENEKMSYAVETPYGFQLDLDFLKYVDDIQSGQTLKKLQVGRKPRGPRRSTSSLRSLSSQTGAWASTESLDLSEDGMSDSVFLSGSKTETSYAHSKETLTLRKSNPLSPTPILKLLPPPPAKTNLKNSRVEKTLEETSRRLQQEQLNVYCVETQDRSQQFSNLSKLSKTSRSYPNLTQTSLSIHQNKCVETQNFIGSAKSPMNSGRSTPAANISPAHLQYIREQMATSLKRLKDLEEQIKIIPALQMKISLLERENKQLTYDLEKQKKSTVENGQYKSINDSSLKEMDKNCEVGVQCKQKSILEPTGHKTSKIAELKRLTEKLSDTEKNLGGKKTLGEKQSGKYPAVKEKTRKSIAVGEDVSMADSVFYYTSNRKDVAVQASPETKDVGEWVMESLLGISSDVEKEIQLFQHTVEHQKAVINMLEDHVKAAADELEELRIAVASRQAMGLMDKDMIHQENHVKPLIDISMPNGKKLPEDSSKMKDTEMLSPNTSSFNISDVTDTGVSEEMVTAIESEEIQCLKVLCNKQDHHLGNRESNLEKSSDAKDKQSVITPYSPDTLHCPDGDEHNEDEEGSRIFKALDMLVTGHTQVLAS